MTQVAQLVLSTVLRDEPWQDLGFAKRPQHGEIAQAFRPLWRFQLEKAILKQMVALLSAVHIRAGVLEEYDISELVEILVDGPAGMTDLWRTYGYTSRSEAIDHLISEISSYGEAQPGQWVAMLGSRLDVTSLPDKNLVAQLLVGVVRFVQNVENMIKYLQAQARLPKKPMMPLAIDRQLLGGRAVSTRTVTDSTPRDLAWALVVANAFALGVVAFLTAGDLYLASTWILGAGVFAAVITAVFCAIRRSERRVFRRSFVMATWVVFVLILFGERL